MIIRKIKYIIFGAALCFSYNIANAQTCATPPACDSLGYTQSASDCTGIRYTRCPLDVSKYNCAKKLVVGQTYPGVGRIFKVTNNGMTGLAVITSGKFFRMSGNSAVVWCTYNNDYIPRLPTYIEGSSVCAQSSAYESSTYKFLVSYGGGGQVRVATCTRSGSSWAYSENSTTYSGDTTIEDISWAICVTNVMAY